jgi:uncharacterized membrane protein
MAKIRNAAAGSTPSTGSGAWRRYALILIVLDLIGLAIASFLSFEELTGREVPCTVGGWGVAGCQTVATSPYSRILGVPVAVYGVFLSLTLLSLAVAWYRTGAYKLLLAHYFLSLVGVVFEGYFQFVMLFKIKAICIWCESYGISLILRFVVALWVYMHTPKPDLVEAEELD